MSEYSLICFIVVNEFCERFSYYGMKALLTLYFLNYLKWDKDLSTAVYHAFSGLCYFTPILGAFIADSWLGKYKTIIYLSIVYVIGHVVKSVGAIPTVGSTELHIALSMSGLILIALGTGGIKPCVAAFGGDQFGEEHTTERQKFFSIFYMSINRICFGGDCYALAFGVPAALMVVALVVFIAGSSLYKRTPPQGNILWEVCNCIGFALKNRWNKSKHDSPRQHWLDWAEEKYSMRLIQEIKMVLRVLVLYIPLPMFWALFDQYTHATCISSSGKTSKLNLGLLDFGACYTVILTEEAGEIVPHKIEDVKANNVHIAYQIPQYILITAGEVMFSITGLEFSYSQAPANMKSVLQAGWLLTVAFGNVIVLIVAEGAGLEQWIEFLLFACLLLGVCIIFSIMAHFYTYVDPEEMDKLYLENSVREEDDSDFKKKNNEIQLNKTGKSTRM
uniref:Solute carrier family 15 member 2 n=1 Tax=Oreochromis niloticus TaxID=8128 RepID=A0A669BK10_ORENI